MKAMAEKKKKKVKTGITSKAKKKSAIARAKASKGTGRIRINKMAVETITPLYLREMVSEPIAFAGDEIKGMNISVTVRGGGFMSQSIAARSAIAKAIIAFTNNKKLRERMLKHDKTLLVDDIRRKEPKKPLGKGARKKRQLSFR